MAMQLQTTLLVSPMSRLANGSRMVTIAFPSRVMSRVSNKVGLRVNCMAEDETKGEPKVASSSSPAPNPTIKTPTPNPSPKKASTSFTDVFAFSGPAPERINGRLAMIGFVAAMAVELSKGTDLFGQISDGGAQWFLIADSSCSNCNALLIMLVWIVIVIFEREESDDAKCNREMPENSSTSFPVWGNSFRNLGSSNFEEQ